MGGVGWGGVGVVGVGWEGDEGIAIRGIGRSGGVREGVGAGRVWGGVGWERGTRGSNRGAERMVLNNSNN